MVMGTELVISDNAYTGNTMSFVRNENETLEIKNGKTDYFCMSDLIASNLDRIDRFAEISGEFVSEAMALNYYRKQNFREDDNPVKTFIGRNVYKDPISEKLDGRVREVAYDVAGILLEGGIKFGTRAALSYVNTTKKYEPELFIC